MKLLLRLKFLGSDFCGWQYQPNARTVQGTLTAAAREVFGTDCRITGCSRTDSGVHANDFAAFCGLPDPVRTDPGGVCHAAAPGCLRDGGFAGRG